MKDIYNNKLMNILNPFSRNFNVTLDEGVVDNTAF